MSHVCFDKKSKLSSQRSKCKCFSLCDWEWMSLQLHSHVQRTGSVMFQTSHNQPVWTSKEQLSSQRHTLHDLCQNWACYMNRLCDLIMKREQPILLMEMPLLLIWQTLSSSSSPQFLCQQDILSNCTISSEARSNLLMLIYCCIRWLKTNLAVMPHTIVLKFCLTVGSWDVWLSAHEDAK